MLAGILRLDGAKAGDRLNVRVYGRLFAGFFSHNINLNQLIMDFNIEF
ncbi:MAG: hypothetical protein AB7S98_20140 [Burkholderiaceae bacterium]